MTTFQAIIYAIIHGLTEFVPVGVKAQHQAVSYILDWPLPESGMIGIFHFGSLLAVLIYFRHDWASMISSFLQVIIYRKRPMTLDERLPFFLMLSSIPSAIVWYYTLDLLPDLFTTLPFLIAALAGGGILLALLDYFSRRNKGMFDWNSMDAVLMGLAQCLMFVPGMGRMTGVMLMGSLRNFNREAAAKYAVFAAGPALAASSFVHLQGFQWGGPGPFAGISWLTFAISLLITVFAGTLSIGSLMRHLQRRGFGQYIVYRFLIAGLLLGALWLRSNQ